MQTKPWITSEMIVDNQIKQLLHDEREEQLNVELDGYPADILDDPSPSSIRTESYNHMIDGEDYIGFKVFSMVNDNLELSGIYNSDEPYCQISVGGRKISIQKGRLWDILVTKGEEHYQSFAQGDGFYLRIKVKHLLNC